ncbi:MAG: accessory factor UbiK family protein [Proteobacteria bacterium]|jgi:BMFP domain-containing protein YqiC|nr:accessory factor UbiK family protein [Pseudomonadota bacterium]MDA0928440.1 accessory factor UbiK family protein [Pseudomonadota bacterium]
MVDNQILKDLSERLAKIVPMAEDLRDDARTRMEQVLKKSLQDLDVLTRDDFEVQTRALERAEQRIAELERTLSAMEARLNAIESSADGAAD